jgi:asparagine synthase (glutamine-hydrolysing)
MISAEDVVQKLEKVIWHFDEPNGNHTAPAIFLLSSEAKKDVAVVLGGDGGDELFGGYRRYFLSKLISKYRKLPAFLRKTAELFLSKKYREKLSSKGAERIAGFMLEKDLVLLRVLKPEVFQENAAINYLSGFIEIYPPDLIEEDFEKIFMDVDRSLWLADESLVRLDKMSMASGLEARVPILDYRLAEISQKIPTSWKISNRDSKTIFKEAFQEYYLPHLRNQPKRGWFSPMAKWLREEPLKSMAEDILSSLPAEYFSNQTAMKIFKDHLSGKIYNLNILWSLISFGIWYKIFMENKNV